MAAVPVVDDRPKINCNFVNPKYHTSYTYYIAGDMVGEHNLINLRELKENNVMLIDTFSPCEH